MAAQGDSTVREMDDLIGEVAARTGIKLGRDDPAFALVVLNQLILRSEVEQLVAGVRRSISEFEKAADAIQARAGSTLAKEVRECISAVRTPQPLSRAPAHRGVWLIAGGMAIGVAFAAGLWVAQLMK
jgi:hypothetical protein